MSLIFDTKEDLQLRMLDLQEKLKKSEEERKKLEKTCDALIRAFREDERMHYKALNNQYENFLEDCRLRKKRNDIILKSLCKVEDRAKSLYNKTEKLKLLKDRYTAYLKQNDFLKKEEIQNVTVSKPKTLIKGDTVSKFVHWRTPNLEDVMDCNGKDILHLSESSKLETYLENSEKEIHEKMFLTTQMSNKQNDLYNFLMENQNKGASIKEGENSSKVTILKEEESNKSFANMENLELKQLIIMENDNESFAKVLPKERNFEEKNKSSNVNHNALDNNVLSKNSLSNNVPYTIEKTITASPSTSVMESEIPELKVFSSDKNRNNKIDKRNFETNKTVQNEELENKFKKPVIGYILEKNDFKVEDLKNNKKIFQTISENSVETNSEKLFQNAGQDPKSPVALMVSTKENPTFTNEIEENIEEKNFQNFSNSANDELFSNIKIYPKSMDGVDYENETYPDSYYEQPEYTHNVSNIASHVILEEDEYELDGEQEKLLSFTSSQNLPTNNVTESIQPSQKDIENNDITFAFSFNKVSNEKNDYVTLNESLLPVEEKCSALKESNDFSENIIENCQISNNGSEPFKSQDTDSEKSLQEQKESIFDFSLRNEFQQKNTNETDIINEKKVSDTEENTNLTRSNLMHLLESDSESFQIEHGESVSGNDDSDFDFTFRN